MSKGRQPDVTRWTTQAASGADCAGSCWSIIVLERGSGGSPLQLSTAQPSLCRRLHSPTPQPEGHSPPSRVSSLGSVHLRGRLARNWETPQPCDKWHQLPSPPNEWIRCVYCKGHRVRPPVVISGLPTCSGLSEKQPTGRQARERGALLF